MAHKKVSVRVTPGHAINLGTGKSPDLKHAGVMFELPGSAAQTLADAGCIEIVNTKEEHTNVRSDEG